MSREYALLKDHVILFRTEGFDPEAVTETVPLSGGAVLLIEGEDPDREELFCRLREAEESIRAKELFLSNMSHDMRTPMNAIMGMTVLAMKHIDEKPRVADALEKIETAGGHLLSLINNVLDMSRINSGRLSIDEAHFSLGDLLHELTILSRPLMEQKKHDFTMDTEDVVTEGYLGDSLRLRQIFVNIISNAAKYTPDGGRIRVNVWDEPCDPPDPERRVLVFRCRDNGIGMSEEFLRHIYDPFERANNTTVSKIEGTGLGMSIVKRLVDVMGGDIAIDSAPGEGTDVRIRIPLRAEKQSGVPAGLAGKRFLILEASPRLAERYRRYFGTGADGRRRPAWRGGISLGRGSGHAHRAGQRGQLAGDRIPGGAVRRAVLRAGSLLPADAGEGPGRGHCGSERPGGILRIPGSHGASAPSGGGQPGQPGDCPGDPRHDRGGGGRG